ncbi:protein bottleneck [Drosophila innubila]|uniref:protein bottleneck n=1 Tax=Drosophila innubila TaxID=198719 RepID=UPI00148B5DF4|nr:protein bottleneck [Drosophila innubila]
MSISTFNFQFYNYKLPAAVPVMTASSFSELEMDIDEEMGATTPITSTPLPSAKQQTTPRFTSELALAITGPGSVVSSPKPLAKPLQALRPQLHKSQKRLSMELREKVLEMSKRNNASDREEQAEPEPEPEPQLDCTFSGVNNNEASNDETTRSVSDKINFFNKLTNTFEFARGSGQSNNNNNRFISLLRSSRPMSVASTGANGQVPPPKPKRLGATLHQFATPHPKPPTGHSNNTMQRKCSLRRKPSMEKSRATIARQNSNAQLRPQRHAMMEDLSLVVPVRLRIAEYEQRISMSA